MIFLATLIIAPRVHKTNFGPGIFARFNEASSGIAGAST